MNANEIPVAVNLVAPLEVARRLNVHPVSIRRWLRSGKLRAVCIGGKLMVDESFVQEFIERGTEQYRRKNGIAAPSGRTIRQRHGAADRAAAKLGVKIEDKPPR